MSESWLFTFSALALVLLLFAALLAAVETAIQVVPHHRVHESRREERRGVAQVEAILADLPAHLNVLIFARTLCEAGAAVSITMIFVEVADLGWRGFGLALAVTTVLVFTLAGVSPRTIGRQEPLRIALALGWLAHGLRRALGPLANVLIWLGRMLTPGRIRAAGPYVTEDQLRDLVERASASEVIEDEEREMIQSVFQLGETQVRQVMVPRPDLVTVDADADLDTSLSLFTRSGFSRVPVVGESEDDVLGVLYLKDVARRMHANPGQAPRESALGHARSVTFIPETKPIDDLLRQMQREHMHVCIAVDEYGGTAGLITIEDIVEEIVGEIDDEHDAGEDEITPLGDGSYRVMARTQLHDLAEELDVELDDEDVTSVGGLLAKAIGKVPIGGSRAEVQGLEIEALPGIGRRHQVRTVIVTPSREAAR